MSTVCQVQLPRLGQSGTQRYLETGLLAAFVFSEEPLYLISLT